MIIDQETNQLYFSDLLLKWYRADFLKIQSILEKYQISFTFLHGTKDIWCRDYMPIQVDKDKFIQFEYNSTYIRHPKFAKYLTNPIEVEEWSFFHPYSVDIILDGGNVVKWKDQVIISDRIFSDNAKWSRIKLINNVEELLQAEVLIIPAFEEKIDMTGHSDGMVRFSDDHTILVNNFKSVDGGWIQRLKKMFKGKGYKFIDIPSFEDPKTKNNKSAIGIYLNYLEIGNLIILPIFADKDHQIVDGQRIEVIDHQVIKKFKILFSDKEIEPVEINKIGILGGLMNCISWNIKV